ncbi:MAG TPA: 1,4-alpha-glucan branching protein GlgB [Bacillota bacterium]|nr:1,4-alpha-glucan branching protein GlgB [Bacillota bacterium]
MDQAYLFNTGNDYKSYNFLGAHPITSKKGEQGFVFRVWAPKAKAVSVIGDFNEWNANISPMHRVAKTGIWECEVLGSKQWDRYKYHVIGADDSECDKVDPYARHCETRPADASILYNPDDYVWKDSSFVEKRVNATSARPISIYEIHLGSWRRHKDGNFMSYREIAKDLAAYCKKMGYTHVELMPVLEHPLDDSWGYQVICYYAVTSRFGTPADFKFFVDYLHRHGVSVILDWVPAHFPKNSEGLIRFDGTPCYEYEDPRIGEHKEWGTYVFDYAKAEVQSFLISNAVYWIEEYHLDGIRVDAVSSMLYRNYGRDNDYIPNIYGGTDNLEAIDLIRRLNTVMQEHYPHVMMIAEESTAWPKVSHPVSDGGLGFTHKWNMGWMHDTLDYFSTDSYAREWHHDQFCFSMMYAFSENFILSLSHDEVVHGKKSLIDKMPGDQWRKFASLRMLYLYMMAHPGAKLNFMGSEFGQFIEWRFYEELEWFLLEYESHRLLQDFVADLNHFYIKNTQLWIDDHSWAGFEWVDASDVKNNVFIFKRKGEGKKADIYVALNMVPVPLNDYKIPVAEGGQYQIVMNTDDMKYGGSGYPDGSDENGLFKAKKETWNGRPYHISLNLPPLGGIYFKRIKK